MSGLGPDLREVARGWRWSRRPLVPRSAEASTPPAEVRPLSTAWARTPLARELREGLQRCVLRPLVWSETRPNVEGLDQLDTVRGPVVFVSNHSSHLDTPLILCSLPRRLSRRVAVGAAADYFFDVRWRAGVTALVFNAFPIERTGGRAGADLPARLVRGGWSLLVYPEGTRSTDGWMGRFRHGAARLCVELGVPAVPIAIRGAHAAMPRGRSWARPGRPHISVRYGTPVAPDPGEFARAFSARLTASVAQLWDEDETDWWRALRRAADGATQLPGGPPAPRWRRVWEGSRPSRPGGPVAAWQTRRRARAG